MNFVTPQQYTKSNLAHYHINTRAANDFLQIYPSLSSQDRLLDFGCGTGETTVAIAHGILGQFGTPGKVVGVDLSDKMITHCKDHHQTPCLTFNQLDVAHGESFSISNQSQFTCLTSFSTLHWVPNMPMAVKLFNKVDVDRN